MAVDPKAHVTGILAELSRESPDAKISPEQLLPLVYDTLRRLARSQLRRERAGHTLQPTDLVHEAYERLADQSRVNWLGRTHFFAVAAQVMRRVLVDHARQKAQQKRGGGRQRVTLGNVVAAPGLDLDLEELIALDRALEKLAGLDEREARVVELRYFGGLTTEEIASVLDVSERTVRSDWSFARAWLKEELSLEDGA
jgi:RNA polymerase sigma-70 factor (ECF subfamily)